jgi:hypothetical protein
LHELQKEDPNFRMPDEEWITHPGKYYITPKGINVMYLAFGNVFYQVFVSFKELGPALKKQSWME